jgi:hypothetical protein
VFAEPLLVPTWSAISQTVKQWSFMIDINYISISARWRSPGTLITVRWHVANFQEVEALFLIWVTSLHHYRKPAEFCELFLLGYPQLSDKTWCSIAAPSVLSFWANDNATNMCYTTSLSGSDRRMCMKSPSTTTLSFPTLLPLHTIGKKYTFWTDHVHIIAQGEKKNVCSSKPCYKY